MEVDLVKFIVLPQRAQQKKLNFKEVVVLKLIQLIFHNLEFYEKNV